MAGPLPESLRALYRWVDAIPLSRPKRNMARDFSDAVLAAEVVKFHLPALVELHSYVPASSTQQKLANWGHLNRKVLSKLGARVPDDVIRKIVQCRPGLVEQVLVLLRQRIEERQRQQRQRPAAGAGDHPGEATALASSRAGPQQRWDADRLPRAPLYPRQSRALPNMLPVMAPISGEHSGEECRGSGNCPPLQILQAKVRRLEQLLRLKNIRIEDLSARLRAAQRPPGPHSPPAPS
uniref:Sperm flagellar 1 n=1 Tax=Nothoprocta perdicaria TaxID=30464 RepID=A0A8C7ED76_NOTPE